MLLAVALVLGSASAHSNLVHDSPQPVQQTPEREKHRSLSRERSHDSLTSIEMKASGAMHHHRLSAFFRKERHDAKTQQVPVSLPYDGVDGVEATNSSYPQRESARGSWFRDSRIVAIMISCFACSVLALVIHRVRSQVDSAEKHADAIGAAANDAVRPRREDHSLPARVLQRRQLHASDPLRIIQSSWMPTGFAGPAECVVFIAYAGLYLGAATLGHATRGDAYSSAMLIYVTMCLKVMVTLVIWRSCDGTFASLGTLISQEWKTLLLYAGPSLCSTLSEILKAHVLRVVDPSTFLVFFNLRVFFLAMVWERLLNRRLSCVHWGALVCILLGCTVKELPRFQHDEHDSSRLLIYGEIVFLGCLGAVASVCVERFLKYQPQVPVSAQNLAMCGFGSMWSFFATFTHSPTEQDMLQWREEFMQPPVMSLIAVLVVLGIISGYFLKWLSNIHREVAVAISMILSLPVDMWSFGYVAGPIEVAGIGIVFLGVGALAAHPVQMAVKTK